MEWDLGIRGIGLLLAMSLGFGVIVQLIMWRAAMRVWWLVGSAAYFVSGVFVSEVWFGWATEEDLQPNIGGLSFDEVLLLTPLIAIPLVIVVWLLSRRLHVHRITSSRA
jgi:hypothetical protein